MYECTIGLLGFSFSLHMPFMSPPIGATLLPGSFEIMQCGRQSFARYLLGILHRQPSARDIAIRGMVKHCSTRYYSSGQFVANRCVKHTNFERVL